MLNYPFISMDTVLDDTLMRTFSVFRNAVNPLLLNLQDQLFKKLGKVI